MGLCPKPRKFFEKNLTKNFTAGKVFGLHSALDGYFEKKALKM
jgi:hypothetical protein